VTDLDLDAVATRFAAALDARPSKGGWLQDDSGRPTEARVDALWDSASDVPDLVVALRTAREALGAILVRHLTDGVPADVAAERARQDAKWGQQDHRDGTGPAVRPLAALLANVHAQASAPWLAARAKAECEAAFAAGHGTWRHILIEEVFEAFAEEDPQRLRTELIQVAAVAQQWVESIDRRTAAAEPLGSDQ
jgi:hypothetical protein